MSDSLGIEVGGSPSLGRDSGQKSPTWATVGHLHDPAIGVDRIEVETTASLDEYPDLRLTGPDIGETRYVALTAWSDSTPMREICLSIDGLAVLVNLQRTEHGPLLTITPDGCDMEGEMPGEYHLRAHGLGWVVEDLQACEPDALPARPSGVRIVVVGTDDHGFDRVNVYGETPEAVIAYVRDGWSEDDPAWFESYVVARTHRVIA